MRAIKGLVKYQLQEYFRTSKCVMPLAALLLILFSLYSVKPTDFINSMAAVCTFIFLIMVWVGVTVCDMENEVSEQILILRVQSPGKYYYSHVLFFMALGALASFISVLVPVLQNLVNGGTFFTRPLSAGDMFAGFILLFFSALSGSSLGELSHSRIFKDRKMGIILVALLAIIALAKYAVLDKWPVLTAVLWVIPPVADLSMIFAGASHFTVVKVVWGGRKFTDLKRHTYFGESMETCKERVLMEK